MNFSNRWRVLEKFKKIFCVFALICIFNLNANAQNLTKPATSTTLSGILTYSNTLKQAIDNSFDLKMSALDIEISKTDLKAARSDLFPIFSAGATTESNTGFGNNKNISYVGNTVISSYSQFRDMASVGVQYNLFDFGATGKKVLMAKKDVEEKKISYDLQIKDLKLKILDLYTKTLECNNEIKTKAEILKVYEKMFHNKERLFKAGTSDKITVMDEAVKIARTQDDIQDSKLELKNALNDLTSYTQQKYEANNIKVLDLDETNAPSHFVPINNGTRVLTAQIEKSTPDLSFDPTHSLEAKYYDLEIEKKKAELSVYKKERLPNFKFYTNYLLYGQDPDQYFSSWNDVKQTSVTVGISANYTIFDGFKNKASREKAALEIKRLQVEKAKKLNDLQTDYEKSYTSYTSYVEDLKLKKQLLAQVKDKLNAVDRMFKSGMAEKNDILTTQSDLLNQEFELQKNIVDTTSKIKEIQIMTGRDGTI